MQTIHEHRHIQKLLAFNLGGVWIHRGERNTVRVIRSNHVLQLRELALWSDILVMEWTAPKRINIDITQSADHWWTANICPCLWCHLLPPTDIAVPFQMFASQILWCPFNPKIPRFSSFSSPSSLATVSSWKDENARMSWIGDSGTDKTKSSLYIWQTLQIQRQTQWRTIRSPPFLFFFVEEWVSIRWKAQIHGQIRRVHPIPRKRRRG